MNVEVRVCMCVYVYVCAFMRMFSADMKSEEKIQNRMLINL